MLKKITSLLILFTIFINSSFAVLNTPLITSPADVSTGNPANTIINWYNVSGANSYEFKIDTNATLIPALVQTSTSSQFANTQLRFGTTYYWQVRALKTTGTPDSSAWTQIISFTTFDSLNITSPANGVLNQFPTVYLNWSNATGITNYEVQLDEVNTFNSTALLDTLIPDSTSNLYVYELRFGTVYYWRVRAMHALDTTQWSISSFTTLDSVVLSAPLNGASFLTPSNLLLNWDYISGITNYQIELDKVPTFNSAALQTTIIPDSISQLITGDLEFGANYYWRVRAWHALDTTQWSQTWNFTTLAALTLNSPADNSINQFPNVILNWNYITSPISYDVEFDTSASFSSPLYFYATNDTVSEHQTSELLFGTKYYWRARAHNSVDTSQWSGTWSFTTIDNLNLVSPLNGAVNIPTRVTLNWSFISGITGYDVRIDTSANYSSALAAFYSPTNSNQQVLNLYFGTKYYWSVKCG